METNNIDTKIKIGVLITDGEKVLLIKEKGQKQDKYRWNIIKGTYGDIKEEDIFEATIRECKEEVGVDAELLYALGAYISNENNRIRVQFNFVAKITHGSPSVPLKEEQRVRNEDIVEVRWFSKHELQTMKEDDFLYRQSFFVIQDWINGVRYPLSIFQN